MRQLEAAHRQLDFSLGDADRGIVKITDAQTHKSQTDYSRGGKYQREEILAL